MGGTILSNAPRFFLILVSNDGETMLGPNTGAIGSGLPGPTLTGRTSLPGGGRFPPGRWCE